MNLIKQPKNTIMSFCKVSCFFYLVHCFIFIYVFIGLIAERDEKTSARPVGKILPQKSLSSIIDSGKDGAVIRNISKLFTPKGFIFEITMVRVITSIYIGGHNLSLTIDEVKQTLSTMIADVTTYFKIKRVFTIVKTCV